MKWWYEPLSKYKHTVDSYDEILSEIVNVCRFKIGKHVVPNYYIYNDEDGLVDIIKGSEIDPLSIARTKFGGLGYDISLSERKNNHEEEYKRIDNIVHRKYERNKNELIEIEEKLNIAEGSYIEEEIIMNEGKLLVKEYGIKYDIGYKLTPYITRTIETSYLNDSDIRNCDNIYSFLTEEYDIQHFTEEHSYVFAIKGSKLLGIYPMSKGTDSSCDMSPRMIFKFLLLIGANSFFIVHNHPNGIAIMSQEDYEITLDIIQAADFMDIEFINHIIIGKNDYECIKEDILEMQEMNCSNVEKYYNNYDIEFN